MHGIVITDVSSYLEFECRLSLPMKKEREREIHKIPLTRHTQLFHEHAGEERERFYNLRHHRASAALSKGVALNDHPVSALDQFSHFHEITTGSFPRAADCPVCVCIHARPDKRGFDV